MIVCTGTGRSGTGWMAATLRRNNIPCGHEAHFTHTGRTGTPVNDSSWMAVPYLPDEATVIVGFRDPLATIRSMLGIGLFRLDTPYLRFIRNHVDLPDDEVAAACRFYTVWNRRALDRADLVLDIRNPNLDALAVTLRVEQVSGEPNRAVNTRPYRYPVGLERLPGEVVGVYEDLLAAADCTAHRLSTG